VQCILTGINCPQPPPLPPDYVCRQQLLDEMVSKLYQSTNHSNSYGVSLTVTGAGGFGKTSLVSALCHHPVIKEKFEDGIVFINLGPQATDPSIKLNQLYHLLTGHNIKQGDINLAEQEINQLTSAYCRNLLIIIDDVWHVKDAEPIVKAFTNCNIVLTTRKNDIELYIPTKQVVSVGPMEQSEAIALLTSGVIDISQLSQGDESLLDNLVQDVHKWPLLLSLIRRQLSHHLKKHRLGCHEAIQTAQTKLRDKGLTAFDKNLIGRSHKYAVQSCIEVTLELVTKSRSDKIKSLIIYTGIGTSLQTQVLHALWNVPEHEASDIVDALWAYGLVQFTDVVITPHNYTRSCVEVHAVISQYIIENTCSDEIIALSPVGELGTSEKIKNALTLQFIKSSGIQDISSLSSLDYLKYRQSTTEWNLLPHYIKAINMFTIVDPHIIITTLQNIENSLMTLPNTKTILLKLQNDFKSLIDNCHKSLKNVYKLNRLNQNVHRCLTQRNYHDLIKIIENYNSQYPTPLVAQRAVTVVKNIVQHCDDELLQCSMAQLKMLTPDYHHITLVIIPMIRLRTKELKQICNALQKGSPELIKATDHYFLSGQAEEEHSFIQANYCIKMQEIDPAFASALALRHGL